ncbi:phosphopyruvate hydratase [Candidatus Woesebacteria bacterium]|nr:phosphopyruvate hydratase [Candidatus Woesebacteria bacterium]
MAKITKIWAREIIDSRSVPTVEAACQLDSGQVVVASVPSGASTGTYEALELRDSDSKRYLGKGVTKAVNNVNQVLGPEILGMDPADQFRIDEKLIAMDGSENKSKLGANAILAVSTAACKAGAASAGQYVFYWIFQLSKSLGLNVDLHLPTPLFNMINGGLHGAGNLDFQEFWVIPASSKPYSEGFRSGVEIYLTIGENLKRRGAIHSVGDEGGFAPNLFTNADALEVFVESIKFTDYRLGRDVFLGLDVAANSFYKDGEYVIRDMSSPLDDKAMLDYYKQLNNQYRLAILEDAFHEDAWESWRELTALLGDQVTIMGDDLLVTNPKRLAKAISEKSCNGILVKPNQIGTVTDTIKVVKQAREAGWKVATSHRSGETNDSFIADFAVGVGSDYAKFGAPARGERVAKYNRLSAIETEMRGLTLK